MRKIILTRRARDLAALRTDVDILKAETLDLDRRLRQLEHGTTPGSWPRDVAEFHRHVTHDGRGIEVVR